MKRFEDYEKAYNKCYELLQKLTALIKETYTMVVKLQSNYDNSK